MGYFNILRLYTYNNKQFASQKKDGIFTSPRISFPMAKCFPIYILMQPRQKSLQDHLGKIPLDGWSLKYWNTIPLSIFLIILNFKMTVLMSIIGQSCECSPESRITL